MDAACRCAGSQLQALHKAALQAASRGQAPQLEAVVAASTLGLLLSMLRFALGTAPQHAADVTGGLFRVRDCDGRGQPLQSTPAAGWEFAGAACSVGRHVLMRSMTACRSHAAV